MSGPDVVHVVVPARDEAATLGEHIDALAVAADLVRRRYPGLVVRATLVLDSCTDHSWLVAEEHPWVDVVQVGLGVVGAVRRVGVERARRAAAPGSRLWVACTDADSTVPPDWLVQQVRLARRGVELVLGTVRPVARDLDPGVLAAWTSRHRFGDGHPHVHGANLGFALAAYDRVGGFLPLAGGEDVALVEAMRAAGVRWRATGRAPVTTSGRREGRAVGGFAAYLLGLVP